MTSVQLFFLIILGIVVGPPVLKWSAVTGYRLFKKLKPKVKKFFKERKKRSKKYQEKEELRQKRLSRISKHSTLNFENVKNHQKKDIDVREEISCDPAKLDEYVILKGELIIQTVHGTTIQDPIYLFQPRVSTLNGVSLGPKLKSNGHLSDKYSYLAKDSTTGAILSGYVPKREVVSGMQFDFVNDSVHNNNGDISRFIDIKIPKDSEGNFIPVNLNNANELREFSNYLKMFKRNNIDPSKHFLKYLDYASESLNAYYESIEPDYAEPIKIKMDESVNKVKDSRRPKEDPYRFYERFNYWQRFPGPPGPHHGGPHGGPRGPRPHGGPRGPR